MHNYVYNYKCSNLQTLPSKFVFLVSFYLPFSFPGVRLDYKLYKVQSQTIYFFTKTIYSLSATRKVYSMNSLLSSVLYIVFWWKEIFCFCFLFISQRLLEQNSLVVNLCRFREAKRSSTNMSNWYDKVYHLFQWSFEYCMVYCYTHTSLWKIN